MRGEAVEKKPTKRGATNRNDRGNTTDRRARREYLCSKFRADVDLVAAFYSDGTVRVGASPFTPDPGCAAYIDLLHSWDRGAEAGRIVGWHPRPRLVRVEVLPACRCYCCGTLLHAGTDDLEGTVTSDRILPGCEGGTYARANLRPACGLHNSKTGGVLGAARRKARKVAQDPS